MWKNFKIFFGDQLAIFPFPIQISFKIVNSVFPFKMLNFAISSVFRPKRFCSVLKNRSWKRYYRVLKKSFWFCHLSGTPANKWTINLATAEKQHVSCACLSRPANGSYNALGQHRRCTTDHSLVVISYRQYQLRICGLWSFLTLYTHIRLSRSSVFVSLENSQELS